MGIFVGVFEEVLDIWDFVAALDLPISHRVCTGTKPVSVSRVYSSGNIGFSTVLGLTGSAMETARERPLSFKDFEVSVFTIRRDSALERVEERFPEICDWASSGSYT